jgi:transketolase
MSIKSIAMRDAFLERVWQAMSSDDKVFFVCADFGSPVLDKVREQFPSRFINVGIAEQNLINISAGLSLEGYKVFAYAIAPFITMRCFEQIRVNLALLSEVRPMNVTLIGVGAGYSYVVSGPTHQCYEDLTLMRALPNVQVMSPADHVTSAALFDQCLASPGLKYVRLDAQVLPVLYPVQAPEMSLGYQVRRQGSEVCIIATGYMTHTAHKVIDRLASSGISIGLVDLFDVTGFNVEQLLAIIKNYKGIVTLEEGFRGRGGVDALLFDLLSRRRPDIRVLNIGVEPGYRFELGTREELHEQVGIGVEAVDKKIRSFVSGFVTT